MTEPDPGARSVTEALALARGSIAGPSARVDAEMLLARAIGKPRSWLYAHPDAGVDETQTRILASLLDRRRRGEPIALILGSREFWSLELTVTADTLIPRPETELLVELALARMVGRPRCTVLDLGTGSGAIALALASERPDARITAVEANARTLAVAQKNAARLGLARVQFLLGDWFSPVSDERYEVIVGNPPYIAQDDPHLSQGDLRFEPRAALVSGIDGLDALRSISMRAPEHLVAGGFLLLEHGYEQGERVRELLLASGFIDVGTRVDLEGRERVTLGRAPE